MERYGKTGGWVYDTVGAVTGTVENIIYVMKFTTDVVDNAIIDDGRTGNGMMFDAGDSYKKHQMLYNVTEMGNQSGLIDTIGFYKPNVGTSSFPNLTISVAHSDNST